jgi:hypothetical protein
VLAGLLLGAAVALVGFRVASGVLTKLVTALEAGPLRPLLTSAPVRTRLAVEHPTAS